MLATKAWPAQLGSFARDALTFVDPVQGHTRCFEPSCPVAVAPRPTRLHLSLESTPRQPLNV